MSGFVRGSVAVFAVCALAAGAKTAKPLVENVTVTREQTIAFKIVQPEAHDPNVGPVPKPALRYEGLPGDVSLVCLPANAPHPAFSFDNATHQSWKIRLITPPGTPSDGTCHQVECKTTLGELQDVGLCKEPASTETQCVSSAAAIGSCFGPECDVIRSKCANRLSPDRKCDVAVADITEGCHATSCATTREVTAKENSNTQLTVEQYGRVKEQDGAASESFPSAGFEIEAVPAAPPYTFELRSEHNDVIRVDVQAAPAKPDASCTVVTPILERTTQYAAVVPLDNTGVASWVYLNPRNPVCLHCDKETPLPLAFYNRTSDRSFSVSIELPAEVISRLGKFERDQCTPGKPCTVSRTVPPNNTTLFGTDLLQAIPDGTLLQFRVSFYDETEKPANAIAYIRVSEKFAEPPAALQTTIAATVGGILDPFIAPVPDKITDLKTRQLDGSLVDGADGLDDDTGFKPCYVTPDGYSKDSEPALCAGTRVYDGKHSRHYNGSVRVDVAKNLGARADIAASVIYRQSDFGVDDGNPLKLSTYAVNVYGLTGMTLRFGRMTWAAPANGIAITEKGDGYRIAWQNFSLTHIVKRESRNSVADPPNKDNRSLIFQAKSLPVRFNAPGLRALKSLDITAVRGEDKLDHTYKTIGGELFYAFTNLGCKLGNCSFQPEQGEKRNWGSVAGSIAAFDSTRHGTVENSLDGKGRVGLFTATWTPTIRKTESGTFEAIRSYSVQFGKGSSDQPSTTNTREDYVGESVAFAPDTLFLPVFGPRMDAKGHVLVGRSLANRTYVGFQLVDNGTTPLDWIAQLLHVADDVNSRSTTLRYRQYTFGREIFTGAGRDVGREFSADFTIEVPKGVKFSIGGGYLQPGKGIQPVVPDGAWTVTTLVSISL